MQNNCNECTCDICSGAWGDNNPNSCRKSTTNYCETDDDFCKCGSCDITSHEHFIDFIGEFMEGVISFKYAWGDYKPVNPIGRGMDGGYFVGKLTSQHIQFLNAEPYIVNNMTNTKINRGNLDVIRSSHTDDFPLSRNINNLTLGDINLLTWLNIDVTHIGLDFNWPITGIYYMSGDKTILTFSNSDAIEEYIFMAEY